MEDAPGERYPGTLSRPAAASVAASDKEIAEAFFLVLKLNFERGSKAARVSLSRSCKALIAYAVVSCARNKGGSILRTSAYTLWS